ncbi:hypothetical protein C8J56DRAFT_806080 [Mycena floridula]|nr:hypothetical protein C8J56DRAFT_806932 [Mycena floridula]KAJ7572867.1 hypothetical protein C8J56DRAFT_806080 [Mycena floridula]
MIARAALQYGGLIWRLAVDANGPELLTAERYLQDYQSTTLVEEDINIICGVYRVKTDSAVPNWSNSSWFPKPNAWKKSAFDVGFWCPKAESWYGKEIESIAQGNVGGLRGFRTQTRWDRDIKFNTARRKLCESIRDSSQGFLFQRGLPT